MENITSLNSPKLKEYLEKYSFYLSDIRKRLVFILTAFVCSMFIGFFSYEEIIKFLIKILSLEGINIVFTSLLKGGKIKIFGNGTATRDFTYIGDIVSGIISALKKPFPFEIINLGSGRPVEIRKLLTMLEGITGNKANISFEKEVVGESRDTFADITKAKMLLGYKVATPLNAGLEYFVAWFKRNRLTPFS